jgi:diketogulonate reductase-like aldo/keto reductase
VLVQAWAPLAQADRWGDKLLQRIAKRTGKTEAQVLLRWSLQKGFNPLPKSVTPERITQNADVFDFELTDAEMATLETDEYDYHGWDPTTSSL